MIERTIIKQHKKEYKIQEFISETLKNVGLSKVKLQRTPLGEKVVIHTSRPGLVVGRKGESIQRLGRELNESFDLDNAQIEIEEVEQPNLDARIVAERIASNLERFGTRRFKAVMHRMLETIMESGALGVEILISGKVPSQRARRWRVFAGYLKKSGYIAQNDVRRATAEARTRMGMVGIQVSIMPNIPLPYNIHVLDEPVTVIEELETEDGTVEKTVKTKSAAKKPARKKPAKKPEAKDEESEAKPKKPARKKPATKPAAKKKDEDAQSEGAADEKPAASADTVDTKEADVKADVKAGTDAKAAPEADDAGEKGAEAKAADQASAAEASAKQTSTSDAPPAVQATSSVPAEDDARIDEADAQTPEAVPGADDPKDVSPEAPAVEKPKKGGDE